MGNSSGKPVVFTDEVNLNHFRLLRVVGKGAFGKVRIVERKDTGLTFALKYIRKDEIVRSESVRNIIRERKMLEHLNHPFLCNLRYSFQDIEYLYIVVDLMNGGDLRFHISRKTFTEDAVQFWMAELACALRYIHKKGIVHRDLKPDNVLLDSDGHVHLADFNVASEITPHKLLNSKSGTLAYLAPEVYEGRGYATEVDWWSLGVTFYECIYNKRPYEANSHVHLAEKIVKGEPKYPTTNPPVSRVCLHAISSLLEKDRRKRIGAISFESFTDNPFFRSIDFDALERKEIEPVFKPSSEKTNFDATYDLEELLLEEAPLEARARRQKPREKLKDDATHEEIRAEKLHEMIETLFQPFNYTTAPEKPNLSMSSSGGNMKDSPMEPTSIASTDSRSLVQPSPVPYNKPAKTPSYSKHLPHDRDTGNESPSRGTPVRTRTSSQSPNGSPPFSTAVPSQHAPTPPPLADPHALPIQSPDSRTEFSTSSDIDVKWEREREREREREERDRDRHRGHSVSPHPPAEHQPAAGAAGAGDTHERYLKPSGTREREHDSQRTARAHQRGAENAAEYHAYVPESEQKTEKTGSVRVAETRRPQQRQQASSDQAGGAVAPPAPHAHSHSAHNAQNHTSSTPISKVITNVEAAYSPDLDEKVGKPSGMLGFLSRKRGRDRSPKDGTRAISGGRGRDVSVTRDGKEVTRKRGKERERGVLGKEGARVVVDKG